MHASLAVAFAYDRHLNGALNSRRTLEECNHWTQGTSLLRQRLRNPINPEDKDAIWGTAAALAILTFSSPDAFTPEQAWPLKPSDSTDDLDWLRMNKTKMSLWNTVNPLRPDSLFNVMAPTYAQMYSPLPDRGIAGIPADLAAACGLSSTSAVWSDPCLHAAHAVSRLLNVPDDEVSVGHTELFTQGIQGPFKELLLQRDPVALLLLYLWYSKAGRSIWWIEPRARLECPSIWTYLKQHHYEHVGIQALLQANALKII